MWNAAETVVENDAAPVGGGIGGVDSLEDFKSDLELLAEVSARVAARDADMWKRIEFDQREDYYALVTTSRRKLSNADVGFVNAHEDYMPLGKNKRPQWLVSEFRFTASMSAARDVSTSASVRPRMGRRLVDAACTRGVHTRVTQLTSGANSAW